MWIRRGARGSPGPRGSTAPCARVRHALGLGRPRAPTSHSWHDRHRHEHLGRGRAPLVDHEVVPRLHADVGELLVGEGLELAPAEARQRREVRRWRRCRCSAGPWPARAGRSSPGSCRSNRAGSMPHVSLGLPATALSPIVVFRAALPDPVSGCRRPRRRAAPAHATSAGTRSTHTPAGSTMWSSTLNNVNIASSSPGLARWTPSRRPYGRIPQRCGRHMDAPVARRGVGPASCEARAPLPVRGDHARTFATTRSLAGGAARARRPRHLHRRRGRPLHPGLRLRADGRAHRGCRVHGAAPAPDRRARQRLPASGPRASHGGGARRGVRRPPHARARARAG